MISRRTVLGAGGLAMGAAVLPRWAWPAANAATPQTGQTPLPGAWIPQFTEELPSIPIATGTSITLEMAEFDCQVLPAMAGVEPTRVWGYRDLSVPPATNPATYLGPIIVATRGVPTEVTYVNNLGTVASSRMPFYKTAVDKTLHWANPLGEAMDATPYTGPIPAVPHLHGGEIPAALDGGPDAWFTTDGIRGGRYYGGASGSNSVRYRYPNSQQAALIWFHDHALGLTRLNVYAGLAGGYLLVDPAQNLPAGFPGADQAIPLVIQDRMFDTAGQWYFPSVSDTPEHDTWLPEFLGDTLLVNGKPWPFKNVEARRQRFFVLNGSNARTYNLSLVDPVTNLAGPPIWVIGTDGGYLDKPVRIDPTSPLGPSSLLVMPGERYDIIVDFADRDYLRRNPNASGRLLLRNDANSPYPDGDPVTSGTTDRVMEFRVGPTTTDPTKTWDPAAKGAAIRGAAQKIVRLADPTSGKLARGAKIDRIRQLTLNEVMSDTVDAPVEVLVNNSRFDEFTTENVAEGTTELWELVNLTADAHPIHLHLTQFQLLNRQAFDVVRYTAAYEASFPGGAYRPASGPPGDYMTANRRAVGGNPDVGPYLAKSVALPFSYEAGWKDTVMVRPGEVTRLVVRFAPADTLAGDKTGAYPFDPSLDAGYVWHCHIIDHEDNEMMRRISVIPQPKANRTYRRGIEY